MSLQQTIDQHWKQAMKDRSPAKDTLSSIRTEIKNKWIEARRTVEGTPLLELDDRLALEVLKKMAKQRKESIVEYQAGAREDLVAKEAAELTVIESYLPKQLDADAVAAIVKSAVVETGAVSIKDMGKVMKAAMVKIAGQADGKDVQAAVKAALSETIPAS